MEDIEVWAFKDASTIAPLEKAQQMKSEELLEETFVKNPNLLMRGLRLVGRQTPAAGSNLTYWAWTAQAS